MWRREQAYLFIAILKWKVYLFPSAPVSRKFILLGTVEYENALEQSHRYPMIFLKENWPDCQWTTTVQSSPCLHLLESPSPCLPWRVPREQDAQPRYWWSSPLHTRKRNTFQGSLPLRLQFVRKNQCPHMFPWSRLQCRDCTNLDFLWGRDLFLLMDDRVIGPKNKTALIHYGS